MTISDAKQKLVSLARSQVGYREGANNFNKYAQDSRITRLYGWNPQNQPWCCVFVNWCFINAFGYDAGSALTYGGTAACANSADLFRQHGAFVHQPEVGDQIFLYSGGGINHTGIVVELDGNTLKTVEGNYSDGVSMVSYIAGSSKIAGYGRPDWQKVLSLPDEEETPAEIDPHKWEPPTLGLSSAYSGSCVVLQALLNVRHFPCGEADGFFGAKTQAAVTAAQQYYKLKVDGVVGKETWAKLLNIKGD